MSYPLACAFCILGTSWAYTLLVFRVLLRLRYLTYVMLIPAPLAAVFIVVKSGSMKSLLKPLSNPPGLKNLLFGVAYPVFFVALCAGTARTMGWAQSDFSQLVSGLKLTSWTAFGLSLLLIFGEEYGWRGYLLPEFAALWGKVRATVAVGLIWALWHGPQVFGLALRLHAPIHPLILTAIQMGAAFVFSFPFAYLYFRSNSIVPTMLFHFVWNWLNAALLGNIYFNQPGVMSGKIWLINGEGLLGLGFGFLLAFYFLRKLNEPDAADIRS